MVQNLLIAQVDGCVIGEGGSQLHEQAVAVCQFGEVDPPEALAGVVVNVEILSALPKLIAP